MLQSTDLEKLSNKEGSQVGHIYIPGNGPGISGMTGPTEVPHKMW